MRRTRFILTLVAALAAMATVSVAQPQQRADPASPASSGIFSLIPADSVTQHVLKMPGKSLDYTATAGTLSLFAPDGTVSAKVFYTAYVAKEPGVERPLTFAFNGGPGAASAYLHLGLLGPRILDFGARGDDGTTPELRDNPESWLGFTDLVMIDPVGTGWSRASNGSDDRFYGVGQDAESLAKVISLYVQHAGRLSSPKYIVGESYGGFRAAKVAVALKDSQGMLVSGIVMVSPMIDGARVFGASDDPLTAALQFPSLVAAELERRNAFSEAEVAAAERFAMTDYLVALAGPAPKGPAADALYGRIVAFTGMPRSTVESTRGFVGISYAKRVLSDKGQVVSPYDAAYVAADPFPEIAAGRGDDPVLDGFTRAYGPAFAAYARNELGFSCDMTYTLLSTEVNRKWDWDDGRAEASATNDIRNLLGAIPSFRLMIAHGYSDVLTPYGASRYVLDHLPPELAKDRTHLAVYRGGHMFYTRQHSRRQMSEEARAFFDVPPRID
jgi:carboxypeptidase C (cathepsin A)